MQALAGYASYQLHLIQKLTTHKQMSSFEHENSSTENEFSFGSSPSPTTILLKTSSNFESGELLSLQHLDKVFREASNAYNDRDNLSASQTVISSSNIINTVKQSPKNNDPNNTNFIQSNNEIELSNLGFSDGFIDSFIDSAVTAQNKEFLDQIKQSNRKRLSWKFVTCIRVSTFLFSILLCFGAILYAFGQMIESRQASYFCNDIITNVNEIYDHSKRIRSPIGDMKRPDCWRMSNNVVDWNAVYNDEKYEQINDYTIDAMIRCLLFTIVALLLLFGIVYFGIFIIIDLTRYYCYKQCWENRNQQNKNQSKKCACCACQIFSNQRTSSNSGKTPIDTTKNDTHLRTRANAVTGLKSQSTSIISMSYVSERMFFIKNRCLNYPTVSFCYLRCALDGSFWLVRIIFLQFFQVIFQSWVLLTYAGADLSWFFKLTFSFGSNNSSKDTTEYTAYEPFQVMTYSYIVGLNSLFYGILWCFYCTRVKLCHGKRFDIILFSVELVFDTCYAFYILTMHDFSISFDFIDSNWFNLFWTHGDSDNISKSTSDKFVGYDSEKWNNIGSLHFNSYFLFFSVFLPFAFLTIRLITLQFGIKNDWYIRGVSGSIKPGYRNEFANITFEQLQIRQNGKVKKVSKSPKFSQSAKIPNLTIPNNGQTGDATQPQQARRRQTTVYKMDELESDLYKYQWIKSNIIPGQQHSQYWRRFVIFIIGVLFVLCGLFVMIGINVHLFIAENKCNNFAVNQESWYLWKYCDTKVYPLFTSPPCNCQEFTMILSETSISQDFEKFQTHFGDSIIDRDSKGDTGKKDRGARVSENIGKESIIDDHDDDNNGNSTELNYCQKLFEIGTYYDEGITTALKNWYLLEKFIISQPFDCPSVSLNIFDDHKGNTRKNKEATKTQGESAIEPISYYLPRLQVLEIDNFNLTASNYDADWKNMGSLQIVKIENAYLEQLPRNLINGIKQTLRYLDVSLNPIDTFDVVLCDLIELEHLSFSFSKFETIPRCIEYLVNLRQFVSANGLLNTFPDGLISLSNNDDATLRTIDLFNNHIQNVSDSLSFDFKNKFEVSLQYNPICLDHNDSARGSSKNQFFIDTVCGEPCKGSNHIACRSINVGDGICDFECNFEKCMFDFGDCNQLCDYDSQCKLKSNNFRLNNPNEDKFILANGVCDNPKHCNNSKCNYEFGDCIDGLQIKQDKLKIENIRKQHENTNSMQDNEICQQSWIMDGYCDLSCGDLDSYDCVSCDNDHGYWCRYWWNMFVYAINHQYLNVKQSTNANIRYEYIDKEYFCANYWKHSQNMIWQSDILDSSTNDACDSVFDVLDLNEDSMLSFDEAIKIINHLTMDVSLLKLDQINCDMCLVWS